MKVSNCISVSLFVLAIIVVLLPSRVNAEIINGFVVDAELGEVYRVEEIFSNIPSGSYFESNNIHMIYEEDGYIYANQPGTGRIYMYYNINGREVCELAIFEISLPDGVYRIGNSEFFSGQYMEAGDLFYGETILRKADYSETGFDFLKQLWVIRKGTEDRCYTISPFLANNLYLSSSWYNETISLESNVDKNSWWYINKNRMRIQSATSFNKVLYFDYKLKNIICADDDALGQQKWFFYKVKDIPSDLILLDLLDTDKKEVNVRYMPLNTSLTMEDLKIQPIVYGNNLYDSDITWSSSFPSVASINETTGEITSHSGGRTTIKATKVIDGITYSKSFTLFVNLFENGTYYIRNEDCDKYLCASFSGSEATLTLTTNSDHEYAKWYIEMLPTGNYMLYLKGIFEREPGDDGSERFLMSYPSNLLNSSLTLNKKKFETIEYEDGWNLETAGYEKYNIKSLISGLTSAGIVCEEDGRVTLKRLSSGNYADVWKLIKTDTISGHNLTFYYDNAFKDRHEDYMEILRHSETVIRSVFKNNFGLNFYIYSYKNFQSFADECKSENNISYSDRCPGKNSCLLMKKYGRTVACDEWYYLGSTITDRIGVDAICFTGNDAYIEDEESNRSFTISDRVIILNNNYDDGTYIHEISHLLGTADHYHEMLIQEDGTLKCRSEKICSICGTGKYRRNKDCIMNDIFDIQIDSDKLWCNECRNDILYHFNVKH